jgi:hypothetical protein
MLDVALVLLFVALPLATFLLTRSLTWTAVGLVFAFGVAGNAVQSLISLGMDWNVRGIQVLTVGVMVGVAVVGGIWRRGSASIRAQVLGVILPAVVIGLFLIVMRLLASGSPGPLTAVAYLVNHPQAEDNAKWLHLGAQLADGGSIEFNGYAGGPLLLVMGMMAALISTLSMIMLGGVNEVAVVVNTVVGTQFLLIALVPFALAPFVERQIRLRDDKPQRVPWPAVGVAMLVLLLASAVVTSFGHLSLQFVLPVLVLWSTVFIARVPSRARLLMTLAIVCVASVWVPFNVLGLVLLVGALVWVLRGRDRLGLGAVILTAAAVWDALISSTLYLLGFHVGDDGPQAIGGAMSSETSSLQSAIDAQAETARSLFTAPGGVEQVQPLVAGLALAAVVFAVWLTVQPGTQGWHRFVRFAPVAVLGSYLVVIMVGDAVVTGAAPHYGGHKLAFAFTIMALASTLPVAVAGIDRTTRSMTPARWFAVGGIVVILLLDTILPRAISALSPVLWTAVDPEDPPHWSVAEVRPVAEQPISSLPVACAFAPPVSDVPTALPLGQQSYNCTRMLLGMTGLEGEAPVLVDWLRTDWLSNEAHWDDFYPWLAQAAPELSGRTVVLMDEEGGVAGLTTLGALLEQNPPEGLPAG